MLPIRPLDLRGWRSPQGRRPRRMCLSTTRGVVRREYRRQQARREARLRRTRERRAANVRFWLIVLALLALSVYLSIAMWHQVQRLFGLWRGASVKVAARLK